MTNPIEAVDRAERRIAQVAALRAASMVLPAALVALVIGAAFKIIGQTSWERWGYVLPADSASALRITLLVLGMLGVAAAAWRAAVAWREGRNFVAAAEQVDDRLRGKQEIVTFASLTRAAEAAKVEPQTLSRLFPVLWRRTLNYLGRFDSSRAFPLGLARPLRKSSLASIGLMLAVAITIVALIGMSRSRYGDEARRLRQIARTIGASDSSPEGQVLAKEIRATADTLENPKVPLDKKLEMLARMTVKLEKKNQSGEGAQTAQNQSGSGNSGNGSSGKGDSDKGQGEGKGKGAGGQGAGKGASNGGGKEQRGEQISQAKKELAKAKAELESDSGSEKSKNKPGEGKGEGKAPKPGDNPNLPGPSDKDQGTNQLAGAAPKPEQGADQKKAGEQPQEKGERNENSSKGDTHLGQFPQPGKFERFYKAGEHGPPIDLKDARYVLFRIPPSVRTSAGGATVVDKDRPEATTPYANVPLSRGRIKTEVDEKQLIPPRYRDLLQ